jgi:hypothetical protein
MRCRIARTRSGSCNIPRASRELALPFWHRECVRLVAKTSVWHTYQMLADEQLSWGQIEALRAMSGQDRLLIAEGLYWSARRMKAAGVRAQHPDWPEARVDEEARRIFCNART